MSKRILIVDDDPWIRRMLGQGLEHAGFEVETAENGQQGLAKVATFKPSLIVTDVMMDTMDGWTLVRNLRSRSETALIPVIFLTALDTQHDRVRGFRLGADDYLPKPFHFDELRLRIERSLRSVERAAQSARSVRSHEDRNAALGGDLSQLGVSTLLTVLEMERKSGILVVRGPSNGRLFIREGVILAAFIEGRETQGANAVFTMLRWTSGSFEFQALDVDMEDSIGMSVTALLMEGARRIDEDAEAARKAGVDE
jgi:two-component system OmpR family response regulator